jgi:hypothetical protein
MRLFLLFASFYCFGMFAAQQKMSYDIEGPIYDRLWRLRHMRSSDVLQQDFQELRRLLKSADKVSIDKSFLYAVTTDRLDVIQLFLDYGASVNYYGVSVSFERENKERTPLMEAIGHDADTSMIKFLLEKGALVDTVDFEGETALIYAAARKNYDMVKLLILAGADETLTKDDRGYLGNFYVYLVMEKGKAERAKEMRKNLGEYVIPVLVSMIIDYLPEGSIDYECFNAFLVQ